MAEQKVKSRYFIAKVNSFPSLKQAVQSGQWACADRATPPHPREVLTQALSQGKVYIIFSVSNCHGWHGYAEMLNIPGEAAKRTEESVKISQKHKDVNVKISQKHKDVKTIKASQNKYLSDSKESCLTVANSFTNTDPSLPNCEDNNSVKKLPEFYYFDIDWRLNYLEFGELCLNSKMTEELMCIENPAGNTICINKCRNWQEVSIEVGESLCRKMKDMYNDLCKKRDERKQREAELHAEPFYKETKILTVQETWMKIVTQVERDLGKVLLACPFGSQRYNLQTAGSDTDMFIVYQARTRDILGFHPPKQTIKNHDSEACDYTIHEVYRYCELLLSGDARCVECLFLHESTIVQSSPEWEKLKQGRKMFLNRECLDKYLRDAQGSKGTKFLQKWCKDHPEELILPAKMCKMLYVIVRLLQNARDIVQGTDLKVYREIGSTERETLMTIRAGQVPVADAWKIIKELEQSIASKSEPVDSRSEEMEKFLEDWLITLRHNNFMKPEK